MPPLDITWLELVILTAATIRLTRLFVDDDLPPIAAARNWILARYPTDTERFYATEVFPYCAQPLADLIALDALDDLEPDELEDAGWPDEPPAATRTRHGTPVYLAQSEPVAVWQPYTDHPLGTLITCPWCLGFWISLAVTVAWLTIPTVTLWLALPFALSLAAGYTTPRL